MSKVVKKKTNKVGEILRSKSDDLEQLLADQIGVSRFIQVAQNAIYQNEKLAKCPLDSIYSSLLKSAEMGLQPDGRQGALIPYWNDDADCYVAQFQPMVQGLSTLMLRSPGVVKVEARAVREDDQFDFAYGTDPYIEHNPDLDNAGADVVASYAVIFWKEADPTYEIASQHDIQKARNASQASNSPAWQNWTAEMARKVPLKRVSKYVDLTPRASQAIQHDNSFYDLDQEKEDLDEINQWAKGELEEGAQVDQADAEPASGGGKKAGKEEGSDDWADRTIESIKGSYDDGTITAQMIVDKELDRPSDQQRQSLLDWASAKLDQEAQEV